MKAGFRAILGGIFLLAIFGFLGWLLAPALWTDWQIRDQPLVEARDVQVTEAKCRTKLFVLSFCDVEFTDATSQKHSFFYFIAGMNSGETVSIMRSGSDSSVYTTSLGMAYFYDRLLSFLAGVVILLLIVYGIVKNVASPAAKPA